VIDYDAIFRIPAAAQFSGWISVEDGMNGLDELKRSIASLQHKRAEHYA
jgi:sugar phosphate isomerase/epimerase